MNQALTKTLAMKTEAWITPDTIRDYRQSLKIGALKKHSIESIKALKIKPNGMWKKLLFLFIHFH